jgi:hypothetical protein
VAEHPPTNRDGLDFSELEGKGPDDVALFRLGHRSPEQAGLAGVNPRSSLPAFSSLTGYDNQTRGTGSAHAWRVWFSRYAGILAPSQMRVARNARPRSDGVVSATYAAATPADTKTTLVTRRAARLVTIA